MRGSPPPACAKMEQLQSLIRMSSPGARPSDTCASPPLSFAMSGQRDVVPLELPGVGGDKRDGEGCAAPVGVGGGPACR